jgi:hypothetical protein
MRVRYIVSFKQVPLITKVLFNHKELKKTQRERLLCALCALCGFKLIDFSPDALPVRGSQYEKRHATLNFTSYGESRRLVMNRRHFILSSGFTASLLALGAPAKAEHATISHTGSGRATAYSEANKIVTFGTKTHASWLDVGKEGFRVHIRTLDHVTNRWSETFTVGEGHDNHGGPALTVDSKGYLHVIYFAHNLPMRYRKSLRPNDASAWTDYVEVGAQVSYPTLVCGADDTLYLTCRSYSKTEPWTCQLFTKPVDGPWDEGRALLRASEPGYAQFMDAMAWSADHKTLHLSCWFYGEKPGIGRTVGYLKSEDQGKTWTRRDGTPVTLPATADTVEVVAQADAAAEQGLRGSRFALAPDDTPFVLWSDYAPRPQQGWLSFPDATGAWQATNLNTFLPPAFADWGLLTPGGVTFDKGGKIFVALCLIRPKEPADPASRIHPAQDIAMFRSDDGGRTFTGEVPPATKDTRNRWLPNLEAPTGHNRIKGAPSLIFTEGERGSSTDDVVANTVHWMRL